MVFSLRQHPRWTVERVENEEQFWCEAISGRHYDLAVIDFRSDSLKRSLAARWHPAQAPIDLGRLRKIIPGLPVLALWPPSSSGEFLVALGANHNLQEQGGYLLQRILDLVPVLVARKRGPRKVAMPPAQALIPA